jgi:hypothetical protein
MKKLLLSLLLAGFALSAKAQPVADNTFFWSLNAGAALYQHSGETQFSVPAGGLSVGWWLMRPLAFRVAADVAMAPSALQANSSTSALYLMGSAEFMWDVNATFFHVYNKNFLFPCPVYPLIGLGLLYRPELTINGETHGADNDFQAMLGFNMPVRFAPLWDAFLEYKCFFLPQGFDGSRGDNFMHTITLGLTHRWTDDPFHRRTKFESRSTNDDWFIGFGMGASFSSFEFEYVGNFDARLYNFTPELMIGRNYSEVWTIRFELSGFLARERAHMEPEVSDDGATVTDVLHPGHWYTFNCLHTDFMINLTHLFNFRRGVKWNFLPYLGAGPVWRYQDHPRFDVAADAGFMARRYINNMGDFYIDLKYIMVPPRVAGEAGPSGSIFGVGYPMLTFGYIHNFGHSTTRYRMPVNSSIN